MNIKAKVKVDIYRGIGIYENGEITTSTYDTTEGTKDELKEMFKSDCIGNGAKFVKFLKIGKEERLYIFAVQIDTPYTVIKECETL